MPEISNRKWGPSSVLGTSGGVVTWSLVDGGKAGVNDTFGSATDFGSSDFSVSASDVLNYNPIPLIRQAFSAWAQHADISFVQVKDSGAAVGSSDKAHIRIAFGEIDGAAGSTLGLGFLPGFASFSGDILIDSEEQRFFASQENFLKVIVHEIGHAIGLEHVTGVTAVMNPFLSNLTSPIADDIDGIRQIYGAPSDGGELALGFGLDDIEIVETARGVAIRGSDIGNEVLGGGGGERIFGEGGDDRLIGRGGADRLIGGDGADTLVGGAGSDRLLGGGDADVLMGGARDDRLFGGTGRDRLDGGEGDDRLIGGGARDRLDGGAGADRLKGGAGDDRMRGDGDADKLWGARGDDRLFGGAGADNLNGGGGDDTLRGGFGRDRLDGGFDDDLLYGGGGADRFLFSDNGGTDVVGDFAAGVDRLDFSRVTGVSAFEDLTVTDVEDGALITGGDVSVRLLAVTADEVMADDFIF